MGRVDVVEEDDGEPVDGGRGQHLAEVGAADGQDEPVRVEERVAAADCEVGQQLLKWTAWVRV